MAIYLKNIHNNEFIYNTHISDTENDDLFYTASQVSTIYFTGISQALDCNETFSCNFMEFCYNFL